jgi:VWFA-related protein
MMKGYLQAARIACLVQFCATGFAFQASSDGPLQTLPGAKAAKAAEADNSASLVRIDSSLVLIPVHVTAASGASVTDLKKEDFALFEDGVRQTITHFAKDDAPVSAGLLLDISGSMKEKMAKANQAAAEIFQFANPEDEFFLVEFNGRARLTVPFTRDWSEISREIAKAKTSGMTALLDAIHLGIAQMKHARNTRKALIVLSDGGDNFSRRNLRQLRATLLEADVQVYAMGVFDGNYAVKHTREEREGPKLLDRVALDTGGRDFPIGKMGDLPEIGVQIARQLRNQYILGYTPAAMAADGKYHQVNLKLTSSENDLRTFYRRGYYAPAQ